MDDLALPGWLQPLADAARSARGEDFSRFLPPADGSGRQAAVLIALGETAAGGSTPDGTASGGSTAPGGGTADGTAPDGGTAPRPGVLLIERSAGLRQHAGQVAFPGGAVDPDDADAPAAALREAGEEVGLDPGSVRVVAELPALFIPITGFVVTPVLAWWHRPHPVGPVDPVEVAAARVVPLDELAGPENRFVVAHPSGGQGPGFTASGLFVWGFTAGMIDRVLELGGWSRPWDRSRVRPLPASLRGRPAP